MSTGVDETGTIGDPRVEEVSPGIFAYIQPDGSWWINNTWREPAGSVLRSASGPPAGARA
jgi:hypothetical protein